MKGRFGNGREKLPSLPDACDNKKEKEVSGIFRSHVSANGAVKSESVDDMPGASFYHYDASGLRGREPERVEQVYMTT